MRPTESEFEALKRQRDRAFERSVAEACERMGWDRNEVTVRKCCGGASQECYCACPDGPCQHEFDGWREFEGGRGGEQVCSRCGMGAMSHSMRTGP